MSYVNIGITLEWKDGTPVPAEATAFIDQINVMAESLESEVITRVYVQASSQIPLHEKEFHAKKPKAGKP